ncbi:HU family DNA-binding protein [Gimesia sp.]|uniref:HU family DNA-binding protein n=1 Tax=Gimesia sp. TaxID=2024833 RepID=UPI0032EE86CB
MTKKEIVKVISEEIGLTQLKTKEIVQKTFDAIVDTLVTDKRIELRNFGVFEVKKRAARKARNPRTGERVDVEEKYVVTFKPGKEMEKRVRDLEEEAAKLKAAAASQPPVSSPPAAAAPPQQTPPPPSAPPSPGTTPGSPQVGSYNNSYPSGTQHTP